MQYICIESIFQISNTVMANNPNINFDWQQIASQYAPVTPQRSGSSEEDYRQAAQQVDQTKLAEQKMAAFQEYKNRLRAANPLAPSQTVASQYVATPQFYSSNPNINQAMAERTFTSMQSMPEQPVFGRRGPKGEIIPDEGYALAQEVAKARGLDPMGREAAALYGSVADEIMMQRYNDALKYRNAYNAPEDSYQHYVNLAQPGVTGRADILPDNPQAINMSRWTGTMRGESGPQSTMYLPGKLREALPIPELYKQDPMRVNMYRSRNPVK